MGLTLTWRVVRRWWWVLVATTVASAPLRQAMGVTQSENLQAAESIANECSRLLKVVGRAIDPVLAARIACA